MKTYQLTLADGFVDPRWLAIAQRGRVSVTDNALMFQGKCLLSQAPLPEGELMEVWCTPDGFFVCALAADCEQEAAAQKQRKEQEQQAERLQERQRKEAAKAVNAALCVPVKWTPGHKDVLSGLSEGSSGTGLNARSVTHVLLQEALQLGRIRRKAGDFLCTSASATNGKQWSAQVAAASHVQVTCRACLRLAQRSKPDATT